MKLETIKGYKLTLNPFLRKILVLQILAIFGHFWLKNRLSCILLLNIGTLDFFDILHEVRPLMGISFFLFHFFRF